MSKFIEKLGGFLKILPYIILVCIFLFTAIKFKSCTEVFTESKEDLRAKIVQKDAANTKLQEANKENVKAVETIQKSANVSVASIGSNLSEKQKITDKAQKQEISVKQKLGAVIKKYEESAKTLDDIKEKDTEMSTVQIASLWDAYCGGTSLDSQCTKRINNHEKL